MSMDTWNGPEPEPATTPIETCFPIPPIQLRHRLMWAHSSGGPLRRECLHCHRPLEWDSGVLRDLRGRVFCT